MLDRGIELFNDERFDEAESIFEAIRNNGYGSKDYKTATFYLGYVKCFKKEFDDARVLYTELLESSRETHDVSNSAVIYHQLGMVERMDNQIDKAIDYFMFEKNTRKCYLVEDYIGFSANYYELGLLYLKKGVIEKSKEFMDLAMTHAMISEDDTTIACCYRGFGDIEVAEGNIKKAVEWYEDSIRYFNQAGDEYGVRDIKLLIGKL